MEKLIVISSPGIIPGEHIWINKLFDEGLELFHLRKHDCRLQEMVELLDKIDKKYYGRIAIHQYHEIADSYSIKRLHFREKQRSFMMFDKNICYTTSVHSINAYQELDHRFSYSFFSPVFNSISKENYTPITRLEEAGSAKKEISMIALGGVNAGNCLVPFQYGFDGIAVLGAIWENKDPLAAFKQLQTCIITGQ